MNKTFLLSAIFSTITISNFSQEIQVGLGSGIGTYSMSDLKGLNNKISKVLPFENKIVSDFPAYWFYELSGIVKENNIGFGICCNLKSTGSRIASQDYSGVYRFDMKISSYAPCFYLEYDIQIFKNLHLGLYYMVGIELTNLNVNEYLKLSDETLSNMPYKFNAQNFIFHPGIEINYRIRLIGIKLNAGYLFQTKYDSFSSNKDTKTSPYINLNPLKPNWNGYRIGLSIFYRILT